MDYSKKVDKALGQIFKRLKGFAVQATLTRNTAVGFDFNTEQVTGTPVEGTVWVIKLAKEKMSSNHNTLKQTFLVDLSTVIDVNAYDTIAVEGVLWSFGPGSVRHSTVALIEAFREVAA